VLSAVASDPCDPNNHTKFPLYLGERNERCKAAATGPLQCDKFLIPGWYVTSDAFLLNTCPSSGGCGVSYPAWMDGNVYFFLDCVCLFIRIVKQQWTSVDIYTYAVFTSLSFRVFLITEIVSFYHLVFFWYRMLNA